MDENGLEGSVASLSSSPPDSNYPKGQRPSSLTKVMERLKDSGRVVGRKACLWWCWLPNFEV